MDLDYICVRYFKFRQISLFDFHRNFEQQATFNFSKPFSSICKKDFFWEVTSTRCLTNSYDQKVCSFN